MIINPKFNTPAARERLRLIKKSWRSCPNKDVKYRKFRNDLLLELIEIPKTRETLLQMVGDIQMQRSMAMLENYNRNKIKTKLVEN